MPKSESLVVCGRPRIHKGLYFKVGAVIEATDADVKAFKPLLKKKQLVPKGLVEQPSPAKVVAGPVRLDD